jgi:hypothetical protein
LIRRYPKAYLSFARGEDAEGNPYLNLKEIVMNDELELEIIELGDAKEETKGTWETLNPEVSTFAPYKPLHA